MLFSKIKNKNFFSTGEGDLIIVRGSRWVILVIYHCGGPFLRCWAGLPPVVLGPSLLDKGIGTDPIVTHLGQEIGRAHV